MVINLSKEVINTTCNSLRDSKRNLEQQLKKVDFNKKEISQHQLSEVNDALHTFTELEELMS
jgi:hypothetical protein